MIVYFDVVTTSTLVFGLAIANIVWHRRSVLLEGDAQLGCRNDPGQQTSLRSDMSDIGKSVQELDTPSVLIDLDRLEANIDRAATFARDHGISLRPHCKTHKVAEIARMQLAAGAVGLTAAKLGEAEAMAADDGIDDLFIANQVVGAIKVRRAVSLAQRVRLSIGIDHIDHAVALGAAFRAERSELPVMIEIDTGQRRAGVPPGVPAVDLAKAVGRIGGLRLDGIFTHEGHDYLVPSRHDIRAVAVRAQDAMLATAEGIRADLGIACRVGIGSTPSLLDGWLRSGIDEVRVGAYVYLDASMANVVGHYDWCALTVLTTRARCGVVLRGTLPSHSNVTMTFLSDARGCLADTEDALWERQSSDRVRALAMECRGQWGCAQSVYEIAANCAHTRAAAPTPLRQSHYCRQTQASR